MNFAVNYKSRMRKRLLMGLHMLAGSNLAVYCREFHDLESCSVGQLAKLQQIRLSRILRHAVRYVPFYSQQVDWNDQPVLSDFPVLTKADIRNNFEGLMSDHFYKRYNNGLKSSFLGWSGLLTSGVDGESTIVIHDREMREHGRAGRVYGLDMAKIPFGAPYFKLQCRLPGRSGLASLPAGTWARFTNAENLDCSSLDQERMLVHLEKINRSDIEFMVSFGDSAWRLADFAQRENIAMRPLKRILYASTPLTAAMRACIGEVFGAEVRNQYGHRECANIACECEQGGMHVLSNNLLVEVVDDSGKPLEDGETGNILVTLLFNDSFPLIRLRLDDIGSLSGELCGCGRPFPRLATIEGRTREVITTADGRYIPTERMHEVLGMLKLPAGQCQLVQTERSKYELRLVCRSSDDQNFQNRTINRAHPRLLNLLGAGADVHVHRVNSIPLSDSGKVIRTLNSYYLDRLTGDNCSDSEALGRVEL